MSQTVPSTDYRKPKSPRKDWTSFDLDLISCAKNQWVVDFYFINDIQIDDTDINYSRVTGTVQVVDVYFLKIAIPTQEGTQRELWISKTCIALAEPHKTQKAR